MKDGLPEYLSQGQQARLFPVLATTSREGRTTSILLACLSCVHELGAKLLSDTGQRLGSRARLETYTEIVFQGEEAVGTERPDGLIVLRVGKREWRALVEAKIGNAAIDPDQVERYRNLAKEHSIDCVITISNQFATTPNLHPNAEIRKSRSRIPVYHWSWMHILTTADLLLSNSEVSDQDQGLLLNELRRFLSHESTGVQGFDRMPKAWTELNRLISSGGTIRAKSEEAAEVLLGWHQETRDLTLILSRLTETRVSERLSKKHRNDPAARLKDELAQLREGHCLSCSIAIPDAAAPLEIRADLLRRTVEVGMQLRAPEDRQSTKARTNWLLRQIKGEVSEELQIRLLWPGTSEPTQYPVQDLRSDVNLATAGKEHLTVHSFEVFTSKRIGARFAQQVNFIVDIETIVPGFYRTVGSELVAWKKSAPKIKKDQGSEDVTTKAISDEAEAFGRED